MQNNRAIAATGILFATFAILSFFQLTGSPTYPARSLYTFLPACGFGFLFGDALRRLPLTSHQQYALKYIPILTYVTIFISLYALYPTLHVGSFSRSFYALCIVFFACGLLLEIARFFDLLPNRNFLADGLQDGADNSHLSWIENYRPSLPEGAKAEYLATAKMVVDIYSSERIVSTNNQLLKARRARENVKPIGEVQYAVFEAYKRLADAQPKDKVPAFAFVKMERNLHSAFVDLATTTREYIPWSYQPNLHEEHAKKLRDADLDVLLNSPFAMVAVRML